MDSDEQRRRRIACIRNRYQDGEAPVLVCTLMTGRFLTSPWADEKDHYQLASTPSSQLSTSNIAERPPSISSPPPSPPPPLSQSQSQTQTQSQSQPQPQPQPQPEETSASILDDTTQEFDSDNERTIPYDVYDAGHQNSELEDFNIAISSSPPRKLT